MDTLAHATMVVILSFATTVSSAFSCPTLPEMTEVMPGYDQIYSDASLSIIDKDKEQYVLQLMKPIHSAHETLLKLSIDALATSNADEAQCALNTLQGWARSNAHTKVDIR
ncbi:MAG: hypothetical protein H6R19_2123 [Proteobacteria bacterium]|nr:hypothetical protein [Pseudomonadota bacterium]